MYISNPPLKYKHLQKRTTFRMIKGKAHRTNIQLAEWWQRAASNSFRGSIPIVEFNSSTYQTATSADKRSLVKSDPFLLASLNTGQRKVVVKIMAELKRNNALWHYPYRNKGRVEGIISTLRRRNVIVKTDQIDMHLVNPWLIRRGIISTTIAATSILLASYIGLDQKMVKDLKPPKKAQINGFYALQTNGQYI